MGVWKKFKKTYNNEVMPNLDRIRGLCRENVINNKKSREIGYYGNTTFKNGLRVPYLHLESASLIPH